MFQVHLLISGLVQGVGYRQFVKQQAKRLNITGWVKNLPDGRVEILAQGNKRAINQLIEECKKGPFLAQVDNIKINWEEPKEQFREFKIINSFQ